MHDGVVIAAHQPVAERGRLVTGDVPRFGQPAQRGFGSTSGAAGSYAPWAGHGPAPGVARARWTGARGRTAAARTSTAGVSPASQRRMFIASRARSEGLAAPNRMTVTVRPPAGA